MPYGSPPTRGGYLSSPAPPVAPVDLATSHADILEDGIIEGLEPAAGFLSGTAVPHRSSSRESIDTMGSSGTSRSSSSNQQPPSFSDLVKRSTRFITSVPAADVLQKVMCVLESCRDKVTYYQIIRIFSIFVIFSILRAL